MYQIVNQREGDRTPVPPRVSRALDFTNAPGMGITPQGSPQATPVPGGGSNGRSPNAKRPMNPEIIAMAQGEQRTYSVEDLSAGVNTLHQNAEKQKTCVSSTAESLAD